MPSGGQPRAIIRATGDAGVAWTVPASVPPSDARGLVALRNIGPSSMRFFGLRLRMKVGWVPSINHASLRLSP